MDQTKPARRRDPFDEAPDTQFYWSGPARSTPLAEVEAAIDRGNFAIACAGAPGAGRTMFLYRLAERFADAGARFIHPDRVVACKAREAAGRVPRAWQGDSPRAGGKGPAVLLLDDVDQLSRAEMAQLRDWWTPLREKPEKVALVVSCTASAVDPDSGSRRQDLRAMIDAVVALPPLTPAEIEEVIRFRLEGAGWAWENVFTEPALEKIAFYAKGTPKRLVQICSRVMTLAEESGGFPAGPELVKEAAHQLFLPSRLREFSKQISLGLVPVPGSLNEGAAKVSLASSPASDAVKDHDALPEPRAPLAGGPAAAWLQRLDAKPLDAVQRHEPVQPHEAASSTPHQAEDDSEQDLAVQAAGRGIAPVSTKRRRLRSIVAVVAVCGMAVAAGAIGYILGEVDIKPVEVVRIIPQPELGTPERGSDTGESLPAGDDDIAPSPALKMTPAPDAVPVPNAVPQPPEIAPQPPEIAPPPPESVPAPEAAPAPQAVAPAPEAAPASDAVPAPETATPPPETGPAPEIADRVPALAPRPEVAAEPVEPESSEAFAEAEGEAAPPDASADAADMSGKEQEARISELPFDWTPPPLARLSIPGGDGVDDFGSNGNAARSGRTSTRAQGAETQHGSPSANFTEEAEQEAAGSDRNGVGSAERGEVLASVPAVEEPVVRPQRDRVVMRAQALLAQLDLYRAGIDGLLGERTTAAIRDFQKSMSMAETGEVSEALLEALEAQTAVARSDVSDGPRKQSTEDAAVEAAESSQAFDIINECRGKDAEWVYIAGINRHVLCGGLSAGSPN